MKLKDFLIGFLVGVAATVCYFMLSGCGDESSPKPDVLVVKPMLPDSQPPKSDLMPSNPSMTQACFDLAKVLGEKMLECSSDSKAAATFQKTLEDAWDCPNTKAVRDMVELYTVCIPTVKAMLCVDFDNAMIPNSCKSQLE